MAHIHYTGVAFDCSETCTDEKCAIKMIKQRGKVAKLEEELQSKLGKKNEPEHN